MRFTLCRKSHHAWLPGGSTKRIEICLCLNVEIASWSMSAHFFCSSRNKHEFWPLTNRVRGPYWVIWNCFEGVAPSLLAPRRQWRFAGETFLAAKSEERGLYSQANGPLEGKLISWDFDSHIAPVVNSLLSLRFTFSRLKRQDPA